MRNFNPSLLVYCIPFLYFWKSRLKGVKDWVFHSWNEWIIVFLILLFASDFELFTSAKSFVIGYVGFISFYEIGYIFNDFYAVKKEVNPRLRFGKHIVPNVILTAWVLVRTAVFFLFLYYIDFKVEAITFYIGLGLAFALHNLLVNRGLKTFTFLQLALFRFWAPVFLFVPKELIASLLPIVFLYYVFNRTLTYMDSKDLLQLPERTSINFKLNSGILLLVFSLFWSFFVHSWLCLFVALYFLLFWVIVKIINKFRPISL